MGGVTHEDVRLLKRLSAEGTFRPVVRGTWPLDQIVEATRYVESDQQAGNVVLTLAR